MKVDVVMPKMGESVSEGTIIKWHKKVGDTVKRDEIIFEISTDKVDTEIPSPNEGKLVDIKVGEQETVDVGTVVAVIETESLEEFEQEVTETKTEFKVEVKEEKDPEVKNEIYFSQTSVNESESGELTDIPMPKMGESVMEGTIIKWHKKTGDSVKKDETIFEISTDKVDTEVPSPAEGFLVEILVGEQETVEVGTIVARIASSVSKSSSIQKEKTDDFTEQFNKKVEREGLPEIKTEVNIETKTEFKSESSKFFSPLVINIARQEGVSIDELEKIEGTGLGGRVSKKDILSYLENRKTKKAEPVKEEKPQPKPEPKKEEFFTPVKEERKPVYEEKNYKYEEIGQPGTTQKIPMDNIRQKIMQHMINSRDTSVHVYEVVEVDMSRIYNYIKYNRDEILRREGLKLTYMPFITQAVVSGLKEFPLVNASVDGNNIVKKNFINVGIAVAVEPNGLIVPNIKNAGDRNLIGLARAISDLAERARNKKLTPDDITGGTFTITNFGVFGTTIGMPIINQPEVAILGVGAVVKRPVVIEVEGGDTIAIKPIMTLTLGHDHRLVDGMLGGRFLKHIKDTLENFSDKLLN